MSAGLSILGVSGVLLLPALLGLAKLIGGILMLTLGRRAIEKREEKGQ